MIKDTSSLIMIALPPLLLSVFVEITYQDSQHGFGRNEPSKGMPRPRVSLRFKDNSLTVTERTRMSRLDSAVRPPAATAPAPRLASPEGALTVMQ